MFEDVVHRHLCRRRHHADLSHHLADLPYECLWFAFIEPEVPIHHLGLPSLEGVAHDWVLGLRLAPAVMAMMAGMTELGPAAEVSMWKLAFLANFHPQRQPSRYRCHEAIPRIIDHAFGEPLFRTPPPYILGHLGRCDLARVAARTFGCGPHMGVHSR